VEKEHELDRTVRLVRESLRPDILDEEIIRTFQSSRVSCVADGANLSTHAGQTALITFVSLVARMGVQILLEVPEVKILGRQPPLRKQSLVDGLLDLGTDLIPGPAPDMRFVFGDTPYTSDEIPAWRISGTEWEGRLFQPHVLANRWNIDWPIGAMTGAALGAAEVYKAVVRRIGPLEHQSYLFEVAREANWDWGSECNVNFDLDCGLVDVVSAGAIGQAVLYILARVPGLRMFPRIFDDDLVDGTTLNRGMLTRFSDIGESKVVVVGRQIDAEAIARRLDKNSLPQYAPMHTSILVGVDNIPSRWEVQKFATGWLGVAGTSHYGTITSSHERGQPCAGCLHRRDDPEARILPTVSFVSFWAGLASAVRLLRHKLGQPYPLEKQSLWLVPLRMDDPNAGWWSPVAARKDCAVGCGAYKAVEPLPQTALGRHFESGLTAIK
jgi:hypothetical protein